MRSWITSSLLAAMMVPPRGKNGRDVRGASGAPKVGGAPMACLLSRERLRAGAPVFQQRFRLSADFDRVVLLGKVLGEIRRGERLHALLQLCPIQIRPRIGQLPGRAETIDRYQRTFEIAGLGAVFLL